MGKGCEDVCDPCKSSAKVTSEEKDFNNQVDGMTYLMGSSQLLSPAAPVFSQWTHSQNGQGGRAEGYAGTQKHGLLIPKTAVATTGAEYSVYTNTIWHHSWGDQLAPGGRLITLGHLYHGRDNIPLFLEQVIILCKIHLFNQILIN